MLLLREPQVEHIKAADFDTLSAAGAVVLDVRMHEEFDVARLAGAINAPLACLRLLMTARLGLQQEYIVYCDTGRRSRAAVSMLQQNGFRARYLLNGLNGLGPDQRARFLDVVPPLSPIQQDVFEDALDV
jgi:rhodanese-related sulfurtransferase